MINVNVTKILSGLGFTAMFAFGMFQTLVAVVYLDALSNNPALPIAGFVVSFVYLVLILAWTVEKITTQ